MRIEQVRNHFETEAFEYDGLIPRLIPKYHEQHEIILAMLPFEQLASLKVLDLGCGTGILSYLILNKFPNAQVVAFDLAQNMLEACKNNLSSFINRLTLQNGNFGTDDIGFGYDLVISGLSTHHLDNPNKQKLYNRIYQCLNIGGVFINREIVLGATDYLTEQYHSLWRQYIKSNSEDDAKWFAKYQEEDIPATVEDQLKWLKDAGFNDVGCHWRYLNFTIFGGRKL